MESNWFFSTILEYPVDDVLIRVRRELKQEGFGILAEIDARGTFRENLGVDLKEYRIISACNLPFAYQALQIENRVGAMLPCNVVIQDLGEGRIEVVVIDPVASMQAIDNSTIAKLAKRLSAKMQNVIKRLEE